MLRSKQVKLLIVFVCLCLYAVYVFMYLVQATHPAPPAPQGIPRSRCPETSPLLIGPLSVEFQSEASLEQTLKENPDVEAGGRYRPKDCNATQKVAVIIPFRNRDEHLKQWLRYLHPFLQRQQLDYGIFVINQHGDQKFNRAKLLNIGYAEALKDYAYECFVFSDVDLVPLDDRNTYGCFGQPRHLSAAIEAADFRLPYPTNFGGVNSFSKGQYLKINGFPNSYCSWGGEDDDIYERVVFKGMWVSRPDGEVGRTKNIPHARDKLNEDNPERFDLLSRTRWTMATDGINSLSYKVVRKTREPLYTNVTVDVDQASCQQVSASSVTVG